MNNQLSQGRNPLRLNHLEIRHGFVAPDGGHAALVRILKCLGRLACHQCGGWSGR
jgi:hypothetical protein